MFANNSEYGLKALHYIAVNASEDERMMAKDIAKALEIPKPFLSKILKQLANKNFIQSVKGPYGGFYLTELQKEISVLDIIVELEGKDKFKQCVLNFENCSDQHPCPIHELVAIEKNALRNTIKNVRIVDLSSHFNY
ncbi:MAG: Rrf2 family transcriptional regulator [Flavobacteriaceae bacterium]|nr:Rrf2 family transcriptional regulator [Flavobacteriaceae bacterium]